MPKGTLLSILARRPHEELCLRIPEEKDKGRRSVRRETLKQRVRNSSPRRRAGESALRVVGGRYGAKNEDIEQ